MNGASAEMADGWFAKPRRVVARKRRILRRHPQPAPGFGRGIEAKHTAAGDDGQAGECALYAALGGGTGGDSMRDGAWKTHKENSARPDGGRIATGLHSSKRSIFAVSGAFSGRFSFCFPSAMRLHSEHGCAPSKVACTARANDSSRVRSTIIRVHATDCSNAQCPPMLASRASTTMKRLIREMAAGTAAVLVVFRRRCQTAKPRRSRRRDRMCEKFPTAPSFSSSSSSSSSKIPEKSRTRTRTRTRTKPIDGLFTQSGEEAGRSMVSGFWFRVSSFRSAGPET